MNESHDRDHFYKYVTADVAKKILNTLQVKCSSPILFNDPFDSQVELRHDVKNKEDFIKKSTGFICNALQPLIKNGNAEQAHRLVCDEMLKDNDFVNQRYAAFQRFYKDAAENRAVMHSSFKPQCGKESCFGWEETLVRIWDETQK